MKLALTSIFFVAAITLQAQTITIGNQVWMTKNLDVSTFRNGDPIPQAKTVEEWKKAGENRQPAWCYNDNDPANGAKYGKLYNWYAVNDPRGIAPVGYHIPSDAEWRKLKDYLGSDAGTKMKSKSGYTPGGSKTCLNCASWNSEYRSKVPCHTCKDTRKVDATGTNTSGFSGLPGGYRSDFGPFYDIGYFGKWWSSTEGGLTSLAWECRLSYNDGDVFISNSYKADGLSVRCLRD